MLWSNNSGTHRRDQAGDKNGQHTPGQGCGQKEHFLMNEGSMLPEFLDIFLEKVKNLKFYVKP